MKACSLIFILFLFSRFCFAQLGEIKLYGFKQLVATGTHSPYETDEQGKKLELKTDLYKNFFIFISYPPELKIDPLDVWMNGEAYSIKEETVKTPVEITYDNGISSPETIALIPQTSDTVTRIILSDKLPSKTSAIKKSLGETNDLVIIYKLNGKLYSQTLKRIKALRNAILQ
jgi:hypothetical protein